MTDVVPFGLIVLVLAAAGLLAVLSNRVSERFHVPAPAIFLLAAAATVSVRPELAVSPIAVERTVTVAIAVILFDGGLHIGWPRLRRSFVAVLAVGVLGTLATAVALAMLAHFAFGLGWWVASLLGTALAPTDPAVVFSVLSQREVAGRTGTILEGESGANDPVGIALLASLVTAGALSWSTAGGVATEFGLQMAVGAVVGVVGGRALLHFMRRVALPSEALYPLRTFAGGLVIFGLATVLHGSGFLAIFVAGLLLGDVRAPYKGEIERFVAALASLGEIVAFVIFGLTVDLDTLARTDVWVPGLVVAAVLALVVRPVVVGMTLLPVDLRRNERIFVLWSGLKGAVPLLLGSFLVTANVPEAGRLYGIIIVVVVFSVLVQGGLVPAVAHRLGIAMHAVEPEPWALGVRLRDEPEGVHQFTVTPDATANGLRISDLPFDFDDLWISFVIRAGVLVPVRGNTTLQPGDEVLVLADSRHYDELAAAFTKPGGSASDPSQPGRP